MEWLPIETAPKDGSWFIAYRGQPKIGTWARVVTIRWHDSKKDFVWLENGFDIYRGDLEETHSFGGFLIDPFQSCGTFTHWMPLPMPPEEV